MSSSLDSQVDPERVAAMHARELAAFREARPRSAELQLRGRRHMPRGVPMS